MRITFPKGRRTREGSQRNDCSEPCQVSGLVPTPNRVGRHATASACLALTAANGDSANIEFATRIAPRTDATTKDTKSTKQEFAESWNHVIGWAIAAYLRAELLETTGSIWKTVGHDSFFESFVLFVSFVVHISRRLRVALTDGGRLWRTRRSTEAADDVSVNSRKKNA